CRRGITRPHPCCLHFAALETGTKRTQKDPKIGNQYQIAVSDQPENLLVCHSGDMGIELSTPELRISLTKRLAIKLVSGMLVPPSDDPDRRRQRWEATERDRAFLFWTR